LYRYLSHSNLISSRRRPIARGIRMLSDVRYALRLFVQQPLITATVILVLALGTGANTAIFSVVNAVLLQPLPLHDADRLVMVWGHQRREGDGSGPVSAPAFAVWKARNSVFEGIAASSDAVFNLTGAGDPVSITGYRFDADFFGVLGIQPMLGRTFLPEEATPGRPRVAVLGHRVWQRIFNGDATVVGRSITMNDEPYIVIGVMPPGFQHPRQAELWTPLVLSARTQSNWDSKPLRVAARLKQGVTIDQAQTEMSRIAAEIAQAQPASNAGEDVRLSSFRQEQSGDIRPALLMLMGAAGFILLITCANLANLLLARVSARSNEMAIRSALGAPRLRLVRQLIIESAVLTLAGAALGLALTVAFADALVAMFPNNIANVSIPPIEELPIDARVLAFTMTIAIATACVFGLLPARQALRSPLNQRSTTQQSTGFRRALLVSEIALTIVLLVGAGLMLRSFVHVAQSDLGIEPARVVGVQVMLPFGRYGTSASQLSFANSVVERLQQLPGVDAAAATNFLPLSGFWDNVSVHPEGQPRPRPGEEVTADNRVATPDYFRTMGIRVIRGRTFTDQDTGDRPRIAIVNESLARRFWPATDPIGRRMNLASDGEPQWVEVVGVVSDIKAFGQEEATHLDLYRPLAQVPFPLIAFTVRSAMEPSVMFAPIRQQIWSVDPQLPTFREDTMEQLAAESTALRRISLQLLGAFALLALVLAAVGTYGVLSYSVAQRLPELGVRMALGASRGTIMSLVLGELGKTTLAGVIIGLVASFVVARLASSLLVGVTSTDPVVYALTCGLLVVVAFVAGYLPARRASRLDPTAVLRCQ
jgi:putative ABC transport system permease protein